MDGGGTALHGEAPVPITKTDEDMIVLPYEKYT